MYVLYAAFLFLPSIYLWVMNERKNYMFYLKIYLTGTFTKSKDADEMLHYAFFIVKVSL